ncbi:SAM-dependent methyltransferase [Nocardia abscessus]|uniref:SAM-dependent methyltransferase n=1 Tax=Nocardia abscessus TaxID=120957 RepID=UPI002453A2E7|nr:SAM-dependent methyltransferase [Nocardia abscessus]
MREYIDALTPGSYVAITHFHDPDDGTEAHRIARELERRFLETGMGSGWYCTRAQIPGLFGDLDLIAPGLAELADWWPTGARAAASLDPGAADARRPGIQAVRPPRFGPSDPATTGYHHRGARPSPSPRDDDHQPPLFHRGQYTAIEPDKTAPAPWRADLEHFLTTTTLDTWL